MDSISKSDIDKIFGKILRKFRKKSGLTQEQLAKRIGKSRSYIANTLRLLQLPEMIQNYVLEGKW